MRIGLVDLDTSHPEAFLPLIRAAGHEVVGVHDSGDVHPHGYARGFADRHGIAQVFTSLPQMAAEVDAAFLHGCDWDRRVERAAPFAEAGVALFVDKPFGGRAADLRQMCTWAEAGVRIAGGSSLRWCAEAAAWHERHPADPAEFALVGCSGDPFDYGVHAYSLLHGLLGPGVSAARHLGGHVQHRVELAWHDGRTGMVSLGPTAARHPFHATVLTETDVEHLICEPGRLYESLLTAALPFLAGQAPAPLPLTALMEPELAALAARASQREGGRWVALDDPAVDGVSYDGAAFAARYRDARYPGAAGRSGAAR
ncbi:hypothetical protein [Streptomyces sp. NPDC005336]|uniref:hypothetical protein n=1 Tax=Streptomyces sp. NPDC005336 TaxID=3157035 RepID=UPI0033B7343D